MMMLNKLVTVMRTTNVVRYAFSMAEWEQIPKPWNVRKTK